MTHIHDRIRECRKLMVDACARADRQAHYGYLAESLGLADAASGRPCDPLQVSERQQGRYQLGFRDGSTVLRLHEPTLVDC